MKKSDIFKRERLTGKKQFLRSCQKRAIRFTIANFSHGLPVGLFIDMGLGKTAAVLTVIKYMLEKNELTKPVLIVGPIRVIYSVWRQEAQEWNHTKDLTFSIVHGGEKKRIEALEKKANIYLTNHESIRWLIRHYKRRRKDWPFQMLVIDESSAYKTAGSRRFMTLRHAVKLFEYRIIMTGTPRPNSLRELWPQIFILDEGQRLLPTFRNFELTYFQADNPFKPYPEMVPREGAEAYLHDKIKDIVISMEAEDWLDFPPTIVNPVYVDLPPQARSQYDLFERQLFIDLERGSVDAFTAASQSLRCWQMANGALYTEDRKTGKKIWEEMHRVKIDALEEIIEETGSPILCAFWFKHDYYRLREKYPDAPMFGRQRNDTLEKEWNDGKHPLVFCHYRSAAHGMNLQYGGRTIVLFSLTWSYELYDQLIKRIGGARAQNKVTVHHLIARRTTDVAQMLRLQNKEQGNRATLNALNEYRRNGNDYAR